MNNIIADRELLGLIQRCEEAQRELVAVRHELDAARNDLDAAREQLDTAREEIARVNGEVVRVTEELADPAFDAVIGYLVELRERGHIKTDGDSRPQVPHTRKRETKRPKRETAQQ